MKKNLIIVYMVTALMLGLISAASAVTEMEILVDKLVEKGILTPAEGDKILRETQAEAKKQKEETKKAVAKELIPQWVSKTKLYGDFRLRYQYVDVDEQRSQSQGRFRVRLNLDIEVAEKLKFIFGIASGGSDPRSSNQSFGDDWDKKQININYAYVNYSPFKWLNLEGGKMANPIYTVSQLLWDEDINPEGVAAQIDYPINPCLSLLLECRSFCAAG